MDEVKSGRSIRWSCGRVLWRDVGRRFCGRASDAAYGENGLRSKAQFERCRHILRDEADGIEKIIRALVHLRDTHSRKKKLATELAYFRSRRHRMRYAEAQAQNLPIGSGVVEAACKTLATQRMKRFGMCWRPTGGQAILTLRALHQSERFERAWKLLAGAYKRAVSIPETSCFFQSEWYIGVSMSELPVRRKRSNGRSWIRFLRLAASVERRPVQSAVWPV